MVKMKRTDILWGIALALIAGAIWSVVTRPPWSREGARAVSNPIGAENHVAQEPSEGSASAEHRTLPAVAKNSPSKIGSEIVFAIRDADSRKPIVEFEFRLFSADPSEADLNSLSGWTPIANDNGYLRVSDLYPGKDAPFDPASAPEMLLVRAKGYEPERRPV